MNGRSPLTWKTAALPLVALTAAFSAGIIYFVGGTAPESSAPAAQADIKFASGPNYAPGSNPMARAASQETSSIEMFRKVNKNYSSETDQAAPAIRKAEKPKNRKDLQEFLQQVRHDINYEQAAGAGGPAEEAGAAPGGRTMVNRLAGGGQGRAGASSALRGKNSAALPRLQQSGPKSAGGGRSSFAGGFQPGGEQSRGGSAARRQHELEGAAESSSGEGAGYSSGRGGGENGGGGGGSGLNSGAYGSHGGGSGAAAQSPASAMKQATAEQKPPPAPVAYIWPRESDFGPLYTYESASRQVIVMNIGDAPLAIGVIENLDDASDFALEKDKCSTLTLAPGKSCTFSLRFAPQSAKDEHITAFQVPSNDAGSSYFQSYIEARGSAKASPWSSALYNRWGGSHETGRINRLDFGMVPEGYSTSQVLRVMNTTGEHWYAVKLDVSKLPPSFKVTGDGCTGSALGAGQACAVTVAFTPTAAVNRQFSSSNYGKYNAVNSNTGEKVISARPALPLMLDTPVEAAPAGSLLVLADHDEYYNRQVQVMSVPVGARSCAPYPVNGLTRVQRYVFFK